MASPDLRALAAATAACASRKDFIAAQSDWLAAVVGFDALYFGAAEPSRPAAPTVNGVAADFVTRCERQADRYWRDRCALNRAACAGGGAVFDRDVFGPGQRDRMPFYREVVAAVGISAIAAVILRARGEPIGCLYLGRRGRGARFAAREIELLRAAAPLLSLGAALHAAPSSAAALESLSPRERQVTALVCRGLTNREIAQALGTSPRTVKNQVAAILRRVGVSNRTELAATLASPDLS